MKQVTADVVTGTYVDTQRSMITFGTVAEAWLKSKESDQPCTKDDRRTTGACSTSRSCRSGRRNHCGHSPTTAYSSGVNWLSSDPWARQHKKKGKEDAGLSPARVIQAHQVVSQVFAYAIRHRFVAINPANNIELPEQVQEQGPGAHP